MSAPVSSVAYTGDGATSAFTIPFRYVNRYDIQAFVNGTQTAFTWNSSGQLVISPAPVAGAYVFIDRHTIADTSGFNFQTGALRPADLNNAMRQCLYIAQEALWAGLSAFRRNLLGLWDALGSRVVNVADPVESQDAATMNWVTGLVTPISTNLEALAEQVSSTLGGSSQLTSKAAFLTAMEVNTPGSVATLTQNIPPDPSDPVNISFNHNSSIVRGDVTWTFIQTLFPTMNLVAVMTAASTPV